LGMASGAGQGQTTIAAAFGGKQGSTTLTVTAATLVRVDVTPTMPSIAKGTQQQFMATAVFTDNSNQDVTTQATWGTGDPSVATVSDAAGAQGLASGVGQGQTAIAAAFGGKQGMTTLTVTAATLVRVDVTPTAPAIAKGTQQQLAATAVFTDN